MGGDLRANSAAINPRENPFKGLASWPRTFISQTGAFSSGFSQVSERNEILEALETHGDREESQHFSVQGKFLSHQVCLPQKPRQNILSLIGS